MRPWVPSPLGSHPTLLPAPLRKSIFHIYIYIYLYINFVFKEEEKKNLKSALKNWERARGREEGEDKKFRISKHLMWSGGLGSGDEDRGGREP